MMMVMMMMMRNKMTTTRMVKVLGQMEPSQNHSENIWALISGVHAKKELQTTALLGEGHILREVGPV